MAHAELRDDGRIIINTTYGEKDLVKMVPGARWDTEAKTWHVPLSWGAAKALRGVFGPRLTIGPRLDAWGWEERRVRVDPANAMRLVSNYEHGDPRLMPHQRADVTWWYYARQGLLGNEPGTGKTASAVQGVRAFERAGLDPFPVLVVCPNTMKITWAAEWAMWDEGYDPQAGVPHLLIISAGNLKGTPTKKQIFERAAKLIAAGEPVIMIVNWEATWRHSRLAPYGNTRLSATEREEKELNQVAWRTVIADEAHRMKDPHAKQTRAVWHLMHQSSVQLRLGMTGTPIANHMGDLWSPMHGLAPHDYPAKTSYIDRYAMQAYSVFGQLEILGVRPDTAGEFYSVLDPRFRRMPKSLVLPYLPKKVRPTLYCTMAVKQRKAYEEIDEQMVTRLEDGSILMATNNLARNTRLIQFASAYAQLDELGNVRLSEPSPKLDAMMEVLDDHGEEPIVITAESRQLIMLAAARLEKAKITYRLIVGGMTGDQRQQAITDFQTNQARVMLMTMKAGGVGITLTAAGTILFLQRSWSLVDNLQAEDRVHRIGSEIHDKIEVLDLITAGTVEELLIPRVQQKAARLEEIVRDRETFTAHGNLDAIQVLDEELARMQATPLWVPDGQQLTGLIDYEGSEEEVA